MSGVSLCLALLDVCLQLAQPLLVLAGVVAAEQELAPGGENGSDLRGSSAPVAAVGSGQIGAGECGVHGKSPSVPAPVGPMPSPAATTGSARVPSTLPDVLPIVSVPRRNERSLKPRFNPVVAVAVPRCRICW